jgi:hypothetical protein
MCIINACSSAREFLVCVGGEGRCYDHVVAAPGMHVWWGQVGRLYCTSWYACVVRAACSDRVADLGICECASTYHQPTRVCHQHVFVQSWCARAQVKAHGAHRVAFRAGNKCSSLVYTCAMGSKYPCRVATLPNTCNAVNVHAVQGTPSRYNMPGMARFQ